MKKRVRFKTHDQLLASGWIRDGDRYDHPTATAVVNTPMMEYFGRVIECSLERDTMYQDGWTITPEMVMTETEELSLILERYDT